MTANLAWILLLGRPSMIRRSRGEEKTVNPNMRHGATSCSAAADQLWHVDRDHAGQVGA
jgi:hypothetical protein